MAGDGVVRHLPGQERQRRLQHRDVDQLAPAGMGALEQRAGDGEGRRHAGKTSQTAKPARVGPVSAWPVIDMMPDIAWILPS